MRSAIAWNCWHDSGVTEQPTIQPYRDKPESPTLQFTPYDVRSPQVAKAVARLITGRLPSIVVEHIGSTAIPDCHGKGVVDLLIAVETGGFPFPEERPLLQGAIDFDGTAFKLHVHVVPPDAEDTHANRRFRDVLRADPTLRDEYLALKRSILDDGVTDRVEYTRLKSRFIRRVLRQEHTP